MILNGQTTSIFVILFLDKPLLNRYSLKIKENDFSELLKFLLISAMSEISFLNLFYDLTYIEGSGSYLEI